jgi:hypothetical protein
VAQILPREIVNTLHCDQLALSSVVVVDTGGLKLWSVLIIPSVGRALRSTEAINASYDTSATMLVPV